MIHLSTLGSAHKKERRKEVSKKERKKERKKGRIVFAIGVGYWGGTNQLLLDNASAML